MVVAHEQPINDVDSSSLPDVDVFTSVLGVPPISVGMIIVSIVVGLFLKYTRWGRVSTRPGGRNEARAAGVLCFG